ncbi:hypothetical protein FRC02_009754 [Tulasnella sp. 418]|nr:hypothetical protein FRC02_009754 [Tulasnella sp. 418]
MPFFKRHANEFSGSPTTTKPTKSNTLQKRTSLSGRRTQPDPLPAPTTTTNTTNVPYPDSPTRANGYESNATRSTRSTRGTGGILGGRRRHHATRVDSNSSYSDGEYYDAHDTSVTRHSGRRDGATGAFGTHQGGNGSIDAVRSKVAAAEAAEREAEHMLQQARQAVHDAKEHVTLLEREADEELRMAEEKRREARSLRKDTRGLGRI